MQCSNKTEEGPRWLRRVSALLISVAAMCVAAPAAWGKSAVWVADSFDSQVEEYLPSQLKSSHTPSAITIPIGEHVWGVCFDKSNNLWVMAGGSESQDEEILGFDSSQLKKLPTAPTPDVTITSSSFVGIAGCTFDKHGNLWLADYESYSLDEVSAAQLKAGTASITPAVIITSSMTPLAEVSFVTFDASGNLWTVSGTEQEVFEFKASQLSSGGAKTAAVTLDGGGGLGEPAGIGFDDHGNLWVANYGSGTLVRFPKSDLGASNDDAPDITISSSSLVGPWGLVFQSSDLWVLNYGNGDAEKFELSKLKKSGAPAPKVLLTGAAGTGNWQITLGPARGKLP
jgi:sugar lactone lactonase YvrE